MDIIYISKDGQDLGGFDLAGINEGLRTGYFRPDDLAWKEGMDSWVRLADILIESPSPKLTPTKPANVIPTHPAFDWQIDYIKDLGGHPKKNMTRESAKELIQFLKNDPGANARVEKRREREERQREKHEAYFTKKDLEEARAALESCDNPAKMEELKMSLEDAENFRIGFWERTFTDEAYETEEAGNLYGNYGRHFRRRPSAEQIRTVLSELDNEDKKWEMKLASFFFTRLDERFPELKKK